MYLNEQSKKVKLLSTTDYNFLLGRIFLQVMTELKTFAYQPTLDTRIKKR